MTIFALKAAARFPAQLRDRMEQFRRLELPAHVELHLCGLGELGSDMDPAVTNCRAFPGCRYSVHFPLFDAGRGYIYDMASAGDEELRRACGFCARVGARELVMHRSWLIPRLPKRDAEEEFLRKALRWASIGRDEGIRILLENWGFVWLPESQGGGCRVSPLDHFFPWEMRRFREALGTDGWRYCGIVLDIAHAVLSANMFNMLQTHPELNRDERFANITVEDLAHAQKLAAADFLFDFIDYAHVSDAWVWNRDDGLDMERYLYREGLPLGSGNLDYVTLAGSLLRGDRTLVMEIEPPDGNHERNVHQGDAVRRLLGWAAKGGVGCA
ncbi:MAG: TIM barrel protein [Elusimicrobia bacterium]|nr:TIM barrel protein [Elusimicrobiota bacterium]